MINENSADGVDFVKCRLCDESMRHLANHIKNVHNMTVEKYMELFPDAKVMSDETFERRSEANRQRYAGDDHHRYNKRKVYLMPDGSYASRTDTYMRAWGYDEVRPEHIIDASTVDYTPSYAKLETFGVEGEDYVTCAECGFKGGNIARHLREKHNMTVEEYQAKYNGSPTKSRKVAEALHNGSLKKWRTQFANGTSTPSPRHSAEPKVKLEITPEMINDGYLSGMTKCELAKSLGTSEVTLMKYQKQFGIQTPSKALTKIRRAVIAGASFDLEKMTLDQIEEMIYQNGIEKAASLCGVSNDVLCSWKEELKSRLA